MKSSTQTALPMTTEDQRLYMPSLASFKLCGLAMGFLIGLFIYLSTLGAEFVAVLLWGKQIFTKTNQELVLFSLAWNLATTLLALICLTCLRILVTSVLSSLRRSSENTHALAAELLSHLEARFAVGALVGICLSWNVTNAVLGDIQRSHMIQSCIILAVACLWCRVTLLILGSSSSSEALIYDSTENNIEEVAAKEQSNNDKNQDDKLEPLLLRV